MFSLSMEINKWNVVDYQQKPQTTLPTAQNEVPFAAQLCINEAMCALGNHVSRSGKTGSPRWWLTRIKYEIGINFSTLFF